jgi:hypothetical protein
LNSFVKRKNVLEKTIAFADLFENFIFLELKAYLPVDRCLLKIEMLDLVKKREVSCSMKYLYWIGVVSILGLGLYFATSFKVHPTTEMKIKFANYKVPEDFGREVFFKLKEEVKLSPIVLLGVTPNQIEDIELWRGFFEVNQDPGSKYDMIVVEPMLPYVELFKSNMRIDIKDDMVRFVEGVKKARAEGLRVAVIVPHIYSTQLLKKNPASRLLAEYKMDILSLTAVKFPSTREQEQASEPACVFEESKDFAGTGALGCAIQNAARQTYRLPLEEGQFSGLMEQSGPKDYLILFNRNANPK